MSDDDAEDEAPVAERVNGAGGARGGGDAGEPAGRGEGPAKRGADRPASTRMARYGKAAALNAKPLPIVYDPDPALRRKARPVKRVTRRLKDLAERMAVTMYRANGVGLAAPQVGVPERIFVVDAGDGLKVFINPEILSASEERTTAWEGCLSIPTLQGQVERPASVRITALDTNGRRFWIDAEGSLARVVQHETDHLDGVLFTDRAIRVAEIPAESRLRVVFFGTPGFAREVLEVLVDSGIRPQVVVTRPDRPRGRGRKVTPTPVRELAEELEIETWTPERLRDEAFLADLAEREPDVVVTAAYGRILPPEVLAIPKLAAVNVHASLLPRWRGAAPIQRAIMAGDAETGVTIMHMAEELDAGDIILQRRVPIQPEDNFGTLHYRLAAEGGEALVEALRLLARGTAPRTPQDAALATFAPAIAPDEEWIDWSRPAAEVRNRVRALSPCPGAKCMHGEDVWKIGAVELADASLGTDAAAEGEVVAVDRERGFAVRCGEGAVWVTELQPAGKRAMAAADFLRGHSLDPGERLLRGGTREGGAEQEGNPEDGTREDSA